MRDGDVFVRMHQASWDRLAGAAETEAQARFGLYATRTLAVRHPEVYLWGDAWFAEGARAIRGFRESYEEPTALGWTHMELGSEYFRKPADYAGVHQGNTLALADVDLDEYRPAPESRILPGPLLPEVDARLAPLAVSLKAEGKVVTPLELAEIAYFKKREADPGSRPPFLARCDDGSAYLVSGDGIWDPEVGRTLSSVSRRASLVWNEHSVWHPMMDRDDRASDPLLAEAVQLVGATRVPTDGSRERLIAQLRKSSALDSDAERQLAALASVRAVGWRFHPYGRVWLRFVPEGDLDIDISRRLCWIRQFDLWANRVSPATAHLLRYLMQPGALEEGLRAASREHLRLTGVVRDAPARGWKPAWRLESWGHIWPCGLMEHTIDDAVRTRTGHCVSQAHMMAAVLEAAGIPHVVVNFDRGGVKEGVNHHFVLSADGRFLVDDGIVNVRGVDQSTEDYGPLLSFSFGEEWASTSGDKLYGNVSSERCAACIEIVDQALGSRFPLTFFESEQARRAIDKRGFLQLLRDREVERIAPSLRNGRGGR